MGVVLAILANATQGIKERRKRKKEEKAARERGYGEIGAPSQGVVREEGQGQSLSPSRPPESGGRGEGDTQEDTELRRKQQEEVSEIPAGGEPVVQKNVAVGAPVPPAGRVASRLGAENRLLHSTTPSKMASDSDYASFLEKANEDPNAGNASTHSQGKAGTKTVDEGVEVPQALKEGVKDKWFTSETDEEFVPVALSYEKASLPDEAMFAKLISHPRGKDAGVQIMDIGEWDPQGEHKEVVDVVRVAGKGGDVRVYRVGGEGSRVEYWIVTMDQEGKRVLGGKVLAVES
ncbi:hypothetical protein BJ875DRAFT_506685 [Amylocarpus encephaloides]|uniref:Uncharacterized protein n=1 Tax=Amylocarpus encephaloides TaxID=45428 RepID=A0A9P7YCL1_9HELO|nr:hypothetical protein BJ875DRAFT_506685 [Amylocarpus encephaloides]